MLRIVRLRRFGDVCREPSSTWNIEYGGMVESVVAAIR